MALGSGALALPDDYEVVRKDDNSHTRQDSSAGDRNEDLISDIA